jgi:hypothetical protein
MINIFATFPVAATTADSFYIPVPCRGIVKGGFAAYSQETDEDETITIEQGSDDVLVFTPPADATAEGTKITGVRDSTYGDLIFDPDSDTVDEKVLKVTVPNTFDTAGVLALWIQYDDSAAITQAASEA